MMMSIIMMVNIIGIIDSLYEYKHMTDFDSRISLFSALQEHIESCIAWHHDDRMLEMDIM